ncbi:MAG: hypothetical protein WDM89_00140 [Rhizomicrobium sp.]
MSVKASTSFQTKALYSAAGSSIYDWEINYTMYDKVTITGTSRNLRWVRQRKYLPKRLRRFRLGRQRGL